MNSFIFPIVFNLINLIHSALWDCSLQSLIFVFLSDCQVRFCFKLKCVMLLGLICFMAYNALIKCFLFFNGKSE